MFGTVTGGLPPSHLPPPLLGRVGQGIPQGELLITVSGIVFCAFSLMYQISPQARDRLSPANRTKFTDFGIIYLSLSLASTVLSTLLIIYRIVSVTRQTLMTNRYKGIIEIIAESAAIYAVTLIIFLPFFARKDFTQGYAQAILVPITVCIYSVHKYTFNVK